MSTLNIMQATFASGELSPLMDARIDQERYGSGCMVLRNMFVFPHGPAQRRSGFRFMGACKFPDKRVRLIEFVFNEVQAYVLEFGHGYMRVWTNTALGAGLVLNPDNTPFEIETPYSADELAGIYHCQSADVMYLAHRKVFPRKLSRHGHADWRLEVIDFAANMAAPGNVQATVSSGSGRTYRYVVTAVSSETGEESIASAVCTVDAAATLNVSSNVKLTWDRHPDAKEYRVYLARNSPNNFGYIGTAGQAAEGDVPEFTDRGSDPDYEQGPPVVQTPFDGEDEHDTSNYPSVVTFYGQRLCFAASDKHPQRVWTSQTANYENMNVHSPLQADDAFTMTIAADRVNSIVWMVPTKKLNIGTVGGEWTLSGQGDEALSPVADPDIQRHTVRGSAAVMPIVVGNTVLYVQRGARSVREFKYTLESDGYDSGDLSVLSEHLLAESPVRDWAYQQDPHSIVWIVRDDGKFAGLTYARDHQVVGWHRHDTDGVVESIASVPGADGDDLWCVVRRTVNGQDVRYMEVLAPPFRGGDGTARQGFFVDCGLTYQGEATTEISGLEHLEGRTVDVLADGAVHPRCVVTDGAIALQYEASLVHVGLPYVSDMQPMKLEAALRDGTAQGRIKKVRRVTVRLLNSLNLLAGPGPDRLSPLEFRKGSHPLGEALPLFTGEKVLDGFEGDNESAPSVFLRQDAPLPMTVLAIITQFEVGGER